MDAESIRKEFCTLLSRVESLAPTDRDDILFCLRCMLPPTTESANDTPNGFETTELCSNNSESSVIPTSAPCTVVLNSDNQWQTPFILSNPLSLNYFVETGEKCTNTAQSPSPVTESSGKTPDDPTNHVILPDPVIDSVAPDPIHLRCPVCRREFPKWPNLEDHLYAAHTATMSPVCWHCQGVFSNHALLLAHECFEWGQSNLPCQTFMGFSKQSEQHRERARRNELDFPPEGVFLKRRCGLCPSSQKDFSTYRNFRSHKKTKHPTAFRDECLLAARRRRIKAALQTLPPHVTVNTCTNPPSTSDVTMSLLAAQRARLHSTTSRDLDSESKSQAFVKLPCLPLTRWLWHRRKRARRSRSRNTPHNPYQKTCRPRVRRIQCHCCGFCFRTPSNLKAHYLFKHGHIPESFQEMLHDPKENDKSRDANSPASEGADELTDAGEMCNRSVHIRKSSQLDSNRAGKRPGPPFCCPQCPQSYTTRFNLLRHERQVHLGQFQFWCYYCEFHTNDRSALEAHLTRHLCIKRFPCQFCGKRFSVRRELADHMAFIHSDERNFKCSICELTFKTKGTLSRHRKIHESRTLHQCTECKATFTRLSNMKRHVTRAHRRPTDWRGTSRRKPGRPPKNSQSNHADGTAGSNSRNSAEFPMEHLDYPVRVSRSCVESGDFSADPPNTNVSSDLNAVVVTCPAASIACTSTATSISLIPMNTIFLPYVDPANLIHASVSDATATNHELFSSGKLTSVYSINLADPANRSQHWSHVNSDPVYLLTDTTEPAPTIQSPDAVHRYDRSHDTAPDAEVHVTQIWRPLDCEPLASTSSDFKLISSFDSDSNSQLAGLQTFQENMPNSVDNELLGSPRFPSPVSGLDSPHPSGTSPLNHQTVVDYITEQCSFPLDDDDGPSDGTTQDTQTLLPSKDCAQLLSPLWPCSNPFQIYSTTGEEPTTTSTEQCSHFSVGFLVGQRSEYAPLTTSNSTAAAMSINPFYTFDPSV